MKILWWKVGFTPRAIRREPPYLLISSSGAISSYLWVLSLNQQVGGPTQFTFKTPPFGASDDPLWVNAALLFAIAIWVCSFIKAATVPASSALFMVLLMPVPLGWTVVNLLDWGWYTPAPIDWELVFLLVMQLPSVKAHPLQLGFLSSSLLLMRVIKGNLVMRYGKRLCGAVSVHFSCVSWVFGEPTCFCHSWQHPFSWRFKKRYAACVYEIPCCIWW